VVGASEGQHRRREAGVKASLLVAVPLLALVTACGASSGPGASGTSSSPAADVSCGVVTLAQADPVGIPQSALSCFTSGLGAGRRVTLTVTAPTTEGDPITTVYTALLDQHVQVDIDSSKDAFAGTGARFTRQVCTGATAVEGRLLLASCADLATPNPAAT
jgi:hypothetical protein